jgi:hypothetical protein
MNHLILRSRGTRLSPATARSVAEKLQKYVDIDVTPLQDEFGESYEYSLPPHHHLDGPVRIERTDLRMLVHLMNMNIALPIAMRETKYLVFGLKPGCGGQLLVAGMTFDRNMQAECATTVLDMPGTSFIVEGWNGMIAPALLIP